MAGEQQTRHFFATTSRQSCLPIPIPPPATSQSCSHPLINIQHHHLFSLQPPLRHFFPYLSLFWSKGYNKKLFLSPLLKIDRFLRTHPKFNPVFYFQVSKHLLHSLLFIYFFFLHNLFLWYEISKVVLWILINLFVVCVYPIIYAIICENSQF